MKASEIRKKFIEYFTERQHSFIPGASLIPENDPSVLFTTAGMHPLVPFLPGEPHPMGKRLVNYQKCLRTDLGHFRIVKEESVSAGVRRIKAVLE